MECNLCCGEQGGLPISLGGPLDWILDFKHVINIIIEKKITEALINLT